MVIAVTVQDLAKELFFDPAWRDMVPAWPERSLSENSSRQIASNNKNFANS